MTGWGQAQVRNPGSLLGLAQAGAFPSSAINAQAEYFARQKAMFGLPIKYKPTLSFRQELQEEIDGWLI